jgi:mannonate dehydratase
VHISQIGGITPALKLIKFCDVYGIRTAWHGPPDLTPIGHAVNAHLDLASPNFGIQEWVDNDHHLSSGDSEIMREIFPGMPECRDGYIYVNDKPGIGVDINEEKAQEYADGNPNMPSRNMTDWLLTRLPDGTAVRP